MTEGIGAAGAILAALGGVVVGHAAASRALPESRASLRLAVAWGLAIVAAYVVGTGLAAIGLFHPLALVTALVLPAALLARRAGPLGADLGVAFATLRGLVASPWGALLGIAFAIAAVRVARGLVLPPMGWDALSYHLLKAGRLVQLGSRTIEAAPGAWGFYEFFPGGGDVVWACALAFARDGMLLAPAGGLVWLGVVLSAYALARELGGTAETSCAAAAAVGIAPALIGSTTAAYVEALGLLAFLAAAAVLCRALREPSPAALAAAGTLLGYATTVKTSYVPVASVLLLGGAVVLRLRPRATAALALPLLALFLVETIPAWRATGSPLYPFPVVVAGKTVLPGSAELAAVLSGAYAEEIVRTFPPLAPLRWLFGAQRFAHSDFAGFGPLSIVVILAGAAAAFRVRPRAGAFVLALGVAALVVLAWSPSNVALRTTWVGVLGRHLLPAFALACAFAATWTLRWTGFAWGAVVAAAAWQAWPRGFGEVDLAALRMLAIPAAIALSAAAGAFLLLPRRPFRPAVVAALAILPLLLVLPGVRAQGRFPIWASALGDRPAYDLHFLDQYAVVSWPMWKRLDDEGPLKLAVLSGWSRDGQSYYLYPLMGSRLQNTVEHVPTTRDGKPADWYFQDDAASRVDLRSFLERLVERGIDRVVVLYPSPPERVLWLEANPEIFPRVTGDEATDNWLYRFDRDAARRRLEANP